MAISVPTTNQALPLPDFLAELEAWRKQQLGAPRVWPLIETGEVPLANIRLYAKEMFYSAAMNPRASAALLASLEPWEIETFKRLAENFSREAGFYQTENHVELMLRFLGALGVGLDEVRTYIPTAETLGMIYTIEYFARRSTEEAIGAFCLGLEGFGLFQAQSRRRGQILRRVYGLPEEALEFFAVHEEVEARDAAAGRELVGRYAQTGLQQAKMKRAFQYVTVTIAARDRAMERLLRQPVEG